MKLSFVLPCYNVGRYIAACLDSIFAQELTESEYEVICVNDCSTDDTRDIISTYLPCHSNLRLIDHAENLTAGGARNTGIEASRGEYIWFVDPDDMIIPQSCRQLIQYVERGCFDIVMFNNRIVNDEGIFVKNQVVFSNSDCCSGQTFVEQYFPGRMSELCIVWRCLFRKGFLIDNQLRYPQIRKSQDVAFLWRCLLLAENVVSIDKVFYSYRCNQHSVANQSKKAHVAFSERILFGHEVFKMISGDVALTDSIRNDMEKTLRWCANDNIQLLSKMPRKEKILYYNEMYGNKEAVEVIRRYMTRKWRWLYANNWTRGIWLAKVSVLSFYTTMKKWAH